MKWLVLVSLAFAVRAVWVFPDETYRLLSRAKRKFYR